MTIQIPNQLQNSNFRFCLLKSKSKVPFEKDWQNNGYAFDSPKLLEHISKGGNYGVIGGYGGLIILDKDSDKLPIDLETFTIQTGSGGKHYYILSDYPNNHVFINEMGELRAKNYQVVGAGSIHPNGNEYRILNDLPIKEIPSNELLGLIKPYLRESIPETQTTITDTKQDTSRSGLEFRKVLALLRTGKSREDIYKEMNAYSKWSSSPEQYRSTTFEKAEDFFLKEEESKKETKESNIPKECIFQNKVKMNEVYNEIIAVLKKYVDLREEYYPIIALWIIGTYTHNSFPTYPYLFFNAMRGSGKSRILNLISKLSYNGKLVSNVSEAVLFRTAHDRTLCIDEFEEVGSKEKSTLRELLNSAYKKGMSVERATKTKTKDGEKYQIESFDVYCPIAMANINGVEDVLSDRCLTLILEKSSNRHLTKMIELFDYDDDITKICYSFGVGSVVYDAQKTLNNWNSYIKKCMFNTIHTLHTHTTLHTQYTHTYTLEELEEIEYFDKILNTSLEGRNLELFFPILFLAEQCDVLEAIIPIAEKIVGEKKQEDFVESRDVSFLQFLSQRSSEEILIPLRRIVNEFKDFEEGVDWVTSEWIGRSLKRLGLIVEKRRMNAGIEVTINYGKAREKIKMFK